MSIFICWSGHRSHELAMALKELLSSTINTLYNNDVFLSDDIDKGVTWFDAVVAGLREAEAGIVCLTPENLNNPWLHFEAGALALGLTQQRSLNPPETVVLPRQRLFTLLHGATAAEMKGPLSAYQATSTTRSELHAMVCSIAEVLGHERFHPSQEKSDIFAAKPWKKFQASLDTLTLPISKLIPELPSLFQQKTFTEPLERCMDQAWISRYSGASTTRERLTPHREAVGAACSARERGLFEMLLSELDGYGMAIQSLLLSSKTFPLAENGELAMDSGIRASCEDRRLAIRSLAAWLIHPLGDPLRAEAVRFMGAETNEERKMLVHRLEGAIRCEWEKASTQADSPASWGEALDKLTGHRAPILFRASPWDLDRIYYYLLIEYFAFWALRWAPTSKKPHHSPNDAPTEPSDRVQREWLCAVRDVELEVERYRSKAKGGSLMPLTYALCALQGLDARNAPGGSEAQIALAAAIDLVRTDLDKILASDAGLVIARLLEQLVPTGSV